MNLLSLEVGFERFYCVQDNRTTMYGKERVSGLLEMLPIHLLTPYLLLYLLYTDSLLRSI